MKVPIPFVDQSLDASDPTDAVMTAAMIVVGFALLFVHRDLGAALADRIESVAGIDQDEEVDLL
jgi:hypothetical protein